MATQASPTRAKFLVWDRSKGLELMPLAKLWWWVVLGSPGSLFSALWVASSSPVNQG